ncbi:MAG TPA: hypothetical protein VKQ71_01315, partial [Acidimicrobiales bacterium]|nr:hypothetical protein [Acidimicrobiales bacterium]
MRQSTYRRPAKLVTVASVIAILAAGCGGTTKSSSSTATTATGGTSGSAKQPAAAPGFDPVAKTIHVGIIS